MVDLKSPGIEVFLNPYGHTGDTTDHRYRLAFLAHGAEKFDLDVAVNATLFTPSLPGYLPGTSATALETVISRGQVNHIHPHSYLLWFDENLNPTQETTKPPSEQAMAKAHWGVGGQQVILNQGQINPHAGTKPDRQTVLAINPDTHTLWIAVFEHASYYEAAAFLRDQGATYALPMDGGHSSGLYLSPRTAAPHTGTVSTGYRPVATIFGIRGRPITDP